METYIGIDPGGQKAFGWCIMEADTSELLFEIVKSGACSGVPEAMSAIEKACRNQPIGAGIDAPLYWAKSGDRLSDRKIRKAVVKAGFSPGTVNHVNSLRGACLVQGILSAVALSEKWPGIVVTESHPKALLAVWPEANEFVRQFNFFSDHERDAALGAYSAFSHHRKWDGWHDFIDLENDIFVPSGGEIAYWFPVLEKPSSLSYT